MKQSYDLLPGYRARVDKTLVSVHQEGAAEVTRQE